MAALRSRSGYYIFALWFLSCFFLPSAHHRTTLMFRIFETKACINNREKNLLNSNTSAIRPHSMANFGPLAAEIGSGVWGTPANFNRFRVLASLLQWRRLPEANQTLQDVCRLLCIHLLGSLAPWRNFATSKIHFTSKSCVLLYWQRYCMALQQWASAKLCGVVQGMELPNFRRGRHLYSAERPSRWASAHILVKIVFAIALGHVPTALVTLLFCFWQDIKCDNNVKILHWAVMCLCKLLGIIIYYCNWMFLQSSDSDLLEL